MSPPRAAAQFIQEVANPTTRPPAHPRVLILAAHPDDETIGASALLGRLGDASVVFLTDGAPRDPQFRSPHVSGARDFYACVRAEEAASALALVNLPPERMRFLSGIDQESSLHMRALIEEFSAALRDLQPGILVTHPYEGGHPDHDTAALVARLAIQRLSAMKIDTPEIVEMTSYHAAGGQRVTGQFLSSPPVVCGAIADPVRLHLSPEERARKARMMGCYVSQWHVISEFPLEPEQLRVAPVYDFSQAPHQGPLWYECLHWAMTGQQWRELASQTLADFGELACR